MIDTSKDIGNGFREIPSQKPFIVDGVYGNDEIAIMQEIAPTFGITIQALTKEGGKDEVRWENKKTGRYGIDTNIVPKDHSYMQISSPKDNFSDFWNAVEAEKKAQQPPANPPKI